MLAHLRQADDVSFQFVQPSSLIERRDRVVTTIGDAQDVGQNAVRPRAPVEVVRPVCEQHPFTRGLLSCRDVAPLCEEPRANGAKHFSLVSALGADRRSAFYYSRVKGELEEDLRRMDWPSLAIFRPSVIEGARTESRPLECLSARLLTLAPPAWRPAAAAEIAAAMIAVALASPPGVTIVESRDIPGIARRVATG